MKKLDNVFLDKDEHHRWQIERAKAGNVEDARRLLMDAALALDAGNVSPALAAYLADCLVAAHADKADANNAFNLVARRRGAPKRTVAPSAERIAAAFFLLRKAGQNKSEAKLKIELLFRIGVRRIEQVAKEYAHMESYDPDLLLDLTKGWRRELWPFYEVIIE